MSEDPIKDVLQMMPYGFYCITSTDGEDVNAMVANWVSQVSFEPRLVVLALQKKSYTHGVIQKGKVFAINLFLKEDSEAIKPFSKSRAKKPSKMENADYRLSPITGCPIIKDAAAFLECKLVSVLDIQGDHDLVIGEIENASVLKAGESADILTLPEIGWSYGG